MEHRLVGTVSVACWSVRAVGSPWVGEVVEGRRGVGVVSGTLLGPEGPGPVVSCVCLWVGVGGGWWLVALVVGLVDLSAGAGGGAGCRLYVENFTVDASIFVAKILRALGGCLGTRNRIMT